VNTPEGIRRPFQIEGTTRSRRSPDSVSDRILDPSRWPEWQPELVSTSGPGRLTAGDVVRGEARMLGFVVHGHSTAVEAADQTFHQDVIVGIRMHVRYEVEADDGGSLITHRMIVDLPSGPAGRVLAFFLRRRLKRLQRTTLRNLAGKSET
jgi:hypothetical protein